MCFLDRSIDRIIKIHKSALIFFIEFERRFFVFMISIISFVSIVVCITRKLLSDVLLEFSNDMRLQLFQIEFACYLNFPLIHNVDNTSHMFFS